MINARTWALPFVLLAACGGGSSSPSDAGSAPHRDPDAGSSGGDGSPAAERDADTAQPVADAGPKEDASTPPGPSDGGAPAPEDAGAQVPFHEQRVVPIYITATDESEADTARYVATYDRIMEGVRTWYVDQLAPLGNYTFYAEPVRVLRGHHTRAEWDDYGAHGYQYPDGTRTADGGGCAMYYGAEHELRDNGLLEAAGLPPLGTAGFVYYAVNGGGMNGSCGAGGYLAASELTLLTKAEANCPEGRGVNGATDCSPVGAIAHELGHGFGLPHSDERPSCTSRPSLMYEWWTYDGVNLCDEEKADLVNSVFFFVP